MTNQSNNNVPFIETLDSLPVEVLNISESRGFILYIESTLKSNPFCYLIETHWNYL